MEPLTLAFSSIGVLLLLLAARVPIAIALFSVSLGGLSLLRSPDIALKVLGGIPYEFAANWKLSAIPMFLLMGAVAYRSGLTASLFYAARLWLSRLPGGLALSANFASAVFAAASGSSVATAAAMGRLAIPEMLKYNYSPSLATGSVAAAGTLGAMIPPSVAFVLYGWFTEASIGKLLMAGVIPGILTAFAFAAFIVTYSIINPKAAPPPDDAPTWSERFRALAGVWPMPLLIFSVIGGIYSGLATPTEAGALGAFAAIVIAIGNRSFNLTVLRDSIIDTLHSGAVVFFIAIGAVLYTRFLTMCGLPSFLGSQISGGDVSPVFVILAMVLIYIVLGMFLDPIGILLLTIPVLLPVWNAMGFDLIWMGVIVVKLLEIGLLTPPVGLNAFVIKSVVGDDISITTIFRGLLWFIALEVVLVVLLVAFPQISLFLPNLMG